MLRGCPARSGRCARLSQAYVELTFPIAAHYATVVPVVEGDAAPRAQAPRAPGPATRSCATSSRRATGSAASGRGSRTTTCARSTAPNVTLETVADRRRSPRDGVRTADGERGPFDVLILATGFKVFEPGNMPPFPVQRRGRHRPRGVLVDENRYQAYQGVSVPGFPNMFSILGPYGYNGASYFTLIENQSRHIVRCLKHARELGATRVEVTREANDRYFAADARPPPPPDLLPGHVRRARTRTTSTRTATCRSARRRRSRSCGAARASTSPTTRSQRGNGRAARGRRGSWRAAPGRRARRTQRRRPPSPTSPVMSGRGSTSPSASMCSVSRNSSGV